LDKAQLFSLDMVIACSMFILILLSTAALRDYTGETIRIEETRNDMEMIARNAISVLIETEGQPSNWTAQPFSQTDMQSLGLADSFLELDPEKISALSSANYSVAKTLLGIIGPDYEFCLDIGVWNGTSYATGYVIGLLPNVTASEVVREERFSLINNTWAKATIRLWKSCEDITC
jgi:hypothetical protein